MGATDFRGFGRKGENEQGCVILVETPCEA
jgi:hypothetical protein